MSVDHQFFFVTTKNTLNLQDVDHGPQHAKERSIFDANTGQNSPCFRDALITAGINCFTSFIAGFVVFSVLGYMSLKQNKDIDQVAQHGQFLHERKVGSWDQELLNK